jgi:hypothetical protein
MVIPLHVTCLLGHVQVVKSLLEHCARKIKRKHRSTYNPLHLAGNSVGITRRLLDAGTSVLSVKGDGNMPMHSATKASTKEVSRLRTQYNIIFSMTNFNKAWLAPLRVALTTLSGALAYAENSAMESILFS